MHVIKNVNLNPAVERGVWSEIVTNAILNAGVWSDATGVTNFNNYGVYATARNATRNYGVWGEAQSHTSASAFGVEGFASGGGVNRGVVGRALGGTTNCGVDAFATGSGESTNIGINAFATGPNAWAGWFDGNVQITGNLWNNATLIFSDGSLKTNVEEVTGALERILQLAPKRYVYDRSVQPQISLPSSPQIGFIAQELQTVVPEAVGNMVFPAQYDSAGVRVSDEIPLLGVDHSKLVPLLVGAIQEQHAANEVLRERLELQQARLDQFEQALAQCCTGPAGLIRQEDQDNATRGHLLPDPSSERVLALAPNPFTEQTTVSYTLERKGRAMLIVNGSDGKHLQVLEEAVRSEGQYQYVWHTAHLAPGIYYVTLLLDGEPMVKRAVKVR